MRVPDHPLALAILRAFGGALAAPSANRFGRVSPTSAQHVRADLGDAVDLIVDGGPARVGVESTIVDLTASVPAILRAGAITASQLGAALGRPVVTRGGSEAASGGVRAPGTLPSHYAPRARVVLVGDGALEAEARRRAARGERVALLTLPEDRRRRGALAVRDAARARRGRLRHHRRGAAAGYEAQRRGARPAHPRRGAALNGAARARRPRRRKPCAAHAWPLRASACASWADSCRPG